MKQIKEAWKVAVATGIADILREKGLDAGAATVSAIVSETPPKPEMGEIGRASCRVSV